MACITTSRDNFFIFWTLCNAWTAILTISCTTWCSSYFWYWGRYFLPATGLTRQSPQLTQAIVTCPNAIPLPICPAHSIWRNVGRRAFGAWARIRDWVYARTEGRISMVWCSIWLCHIRAPKSTCALRLLPATGLTTLYLNRRAYCVNMLIINTIRILIPRYTD